MRTRNLRLREAQLGRATLGLMTASALAQAQANPERKAIFGETHVHTSWSFDAYIFGNTVTGPAEASAYATGEPIPHPLGYLPLSIGTQAACGAAAPVSTHGRLPCGARRMLRGIQEPERKGDLS